MLPWASIVTCTTTSPCTPDGSGGGTGSGKTLGNAGRISWPYVGPLPSDPYGDPASVVRTSSPLVGSPSAFAVFVSSIFGGFRRCTGATSDWCGSAAGCSPSATSDGR